MSDRKRLLTRDFWDGIFSHMHIYNSFHESLIKTLLFLVAFLVSVLPLFHGKTTHIQTSANSTDVNSYIAEGGALIVYGISLIAEVCMLLDPKDFLSKKLLTGAVLFIGAVMTSFGFVLIFLPQLFVPPRLITAIGALSVVIYFLDTTIFYLAKPLTKTSSIGQESKLKNIHVEV